MKFARLLIAVASALVPRSRRDEWIEEWSAELHALAEARSGGVEGVPGVLEFAAGSLPHAIWTRMEGWTMDGVWQDVKYASRVLRKNPGFTVVAVLTLALGIGANASIFSLVNGLLFRAPAGIEEPDRLVQLARSYETDPRWDNFSWPALQMIAEEARVFSGVAGYSGQSFTVGSGAEAERVFGQEVTGNYFEVLGVRPALGRLLQPADDITPGGHPVVVLGHDLWTRRFGADPSLIGDVIQLGSTPYEVVGVAPAGFGGVESIGTPPALFVPTMQTPDMHGRLPFTEWGWSWIEGVARLRDDVSVEAAQAEMAVVADRLRTADSVNEEILVLLAPGVGLDPQGRTEAQGLSIILALIVGVVLLLTCTNVANLLLARASGRRTEVGVRTALGAGRARLMQQLVAESLLLSALATALAVPVAMSADRFVPLLFPYTLSVSVGADARVFLFLAAVGLAAGLLFGVAPAWAMTRSSVTAALKEGGSTGGRTRTRLRDGLVVVQLGMSLGLVVCAALLGRSVMNAASANPGFNPEGLAIGVLDLQSTGRYTDEEGRQLLARIVATVEDLPGVASATVANMSPIVGGQTRGSVSPAGRDDVSFEAEYNVVGGGYFETMDIPVLRGRPLGGLDEEPEQAVVINESLAAMFWPDSDPVGQELVTSESWRVVGVVPDVQMRSLREPGRPGVYFALAHSSPVMILHVRGEGGRTPDPAALQAAVASVDAGIPMRVRDLSEGIAASMGETRTLGVLIAAFAVLALILAAVGLYGLVSYGAAQRVREMGIRIALGAHPDSLVRLILGRGIAIALLGTLLGVGISMALAEALSSLLFQVRPGDPAVLLLGELMLLATAALAAWLPARRASRIDAAISLRDS